MKLDGETKTTKRGEDKANYYNPRLDLPVKAIQSDLTRGVLVTILALFLQIILFNYLQSGGWQSMLTILSSINY